MSASVAILDEVLNKIIDENGNIIVSELGTTIVSTLPYPSKWDYGWYKGKPFGKLRRK